MPPKKDKFIHKRSLGTPFGLGGRILIQEMVALSEAVWNEGGEVAMRIWFKEEVHAKTTRRAGGANRLAFASLAHSGAGLREF